MFFRKCEKKKHSIPIILTIGALAAIGAVSITRCSKDMMNCAWGKMKGLFQKGKDACQSMNLSSDC